MSIENTDEATSMLEEQLNQLEIRIETFVPDEVLSDAKVKALVFRQSQPRGYLFEDVDKAIKEIRKSLDWYANALYKRDLDVHKLAEELGKTIVDLENAKYELEAIKARGRALVDEHGQFAEVDSDAHRVVVLSRQNKELLQKLEQWEQAVNSAEEEIQGKDSLIENLKRELDISRDRPVLEESRSLSDQEREHYEDLLKWGDQVEEEFEKLVKENQQQESIIRDLSSRVKELEDENYRLSSTQQEYVARPVITPPAPQASGLLPALEDDEERSPRVVQTAATRINTSTPPPVSTSISMHERLAGNIPVVRPGDPLTSLREGDL